MPAFLSQIVIANGITNAGIIFLPGNSITAEQGGTLENATIPAQNTRLTLNEGAILKGGITAGGEIQPLGTVIATDAAFHFDLSGRTAQDGLHLNDIVQLQAGNWSVIVDPNQTAGQYKLAGNAAGFNGTITVTDNHGPGIGTSSDLAPGNSVTSADGACTYALAVTTNSDLILTVTDNRGSNGRLVQTKAEQHAEISGKLYQNLSITDNRGGAVYNGGGGALTLNVAEFTGDNANDCVLDPGKHASRIFPQESLAGLSAGTAVFIPQVLSPLSGGLAWACHRTGAGRAFFHDFSRLRCKIPPPGGSKDTERRFPGQWCVMKLARQTMTRAGIRETSLFFSAIY